MPIPTFSAENVEAQLSVRRLILLRWWLLAGELFAILALPGWLDIVLPRVPMLAVFGLQVLVNVLVARRITHAPEFGDGQLFAQLVLDVLALAVLLFLSGGAANPLISLLLPPVAIAALALPARLVTIIAGLTVAAYSLLNFLYLPLPITDPGRAARLHLTGMWFTFVVSVVMLAWFVARMTNSIRQRDIELAAVREQALRDERVIALGALAAGAAHELSTPLATMAVVAGELAHEATLSDAARADIALLRKQIVACKGIISGLTERAGAGRLDSAAAVSTDRWLSEVHQRWLELRPSVTSDLQLVGHAPAPTMVADAMLEQGLRNLFNNAADTGSAVSVRAAWDGDWVTIEVRDQGAGFAPDVLANAGRAPRPVHAAGSGIGLFLARSAIARLGGQLTLRNDGGAVACIRLPARAAP